MRRRVCVTIFISSHVSPYSWKTVELLYSFTKLRAVVVEFKISANSRDDVVNENIRCDMSDGLGERGL